MPYVAGTKKKWPMRGRICILLCLFAAAVLLLPLPTPIRETQICTQITADGEISEGGEITLDLWHMQYLVRRDTLAGQFTLPNGRKSKWMTWSLFDPKIGVLHTSGFVMIPENGDFSSVQFFITEDFAHWLFLVENTYYLISDTELRTPNELNTLFEGFHLWPMNGY